MVECYNRNGIIDMVEWLRSGYLPKREHRLWKFVLTVECRRPCRPATPAKQRWARSIRRRKSDNRRTDPRCRRCLCRECRECA
jgi:hypothetical protein